MKRIETAGPLGVPDGFGDGLALPVGAGDGVAVGDGLGVGVGDGFALAFAVAVAAAVAPGFGDAASGRLRQVDDQPKAVRAGALQLRGCRGQRHRDLSDLLAADRRGRRLNSLVLSALGARRARRHRRAAHAARTGGDYQRGAEPEGP